MNVLIILFAQTKTAATFEIILMLTVAAIIGYFTAWYYSRSVFRRKLNMLKAEKDALEIEIANAKADKTKKDKLIHEKELEIIHLNKKGISPQETSC